MGGMSSEQSLQELPLASCLPLAWALGCGARATRISFCSSLLSRLMGTCFDPVATILFHILYCSPDCVAILYIKTKQKPRVSLSPHLIVP